MSPDRDTERLETILRVIADLERRLGDMDFEAFSSDGDEIDLTAFRLSVIGENANKLSKEDQGPLSIPALDGHVWLPKPGQSSIRNDRPPLCLGGDTGAGADP